MLDDTKNIAVSALTNPQPHGDPTTADEDNQALDSGAAVASPTAANSAGSPAAAAPGAATPAQSVAAQPPDEAKHGRNLGQRVLDSVVNALGGSVEYDIARDPQTGKMIATPRKKTPGEAMKTILAGAFRGMAAGSAQRGPGSRVRSAGAGLLAGEEGEERDNNRKVQMADKDFDEQQKALVTRAQVAHFNQEIATSAWQMTRDKAKFDTEQLEHNVQVQGLLASDPKNQDFGVYPSWEDFLKNHGNNGKQIGQMNANQELRAFPEFKDGKMAGVHVYKINPGWNNQRTTEDQQVDFGPVLDKDGKAQSNMQTIPAGSMTNGELMTQKQATTKRYLDYHKEHGDVTPADEFKANEEMKRTRTTQAGEDNREQKKEDAAAKREETKANAKKKSDLTTAAKNRAELSDNVEENLKHLEALMKKRPDMFGKVKGHLNELKAEYVGTDDQDVLDWNQTIDNLAKANNGMHQMRSKYGLEGQIKNMRLRNGASGIKGAIDASRTSAKQFRDEVHQGEQGFSWNDHPVVPAGGR